eukprot:357444-Chlamydomonas_euryale.AAC.4
MHGCGAVRASAWHVVAKARAGAWARHLVASTWCGAAVACREPLATRPSISQKWGLAKTQCRLRCAATWEPAQLSMANTESRLIPFDADLRANPHRDITRPGSVRAAANATQAQALDPQRIRAAGSRLWSARAPRRVARREARCFIPSRSHSTPSLEARLMGIRRRGGASAVSSLFPRASPTRASRATPPINDLADPPRRTQFPTCQKVQARAMPADGPQATRPRARPVKDAPTTRLSVPRVRARPKARARARARARAQAASLPARSETAEADLHRGGSAVTLAIV